MTMPSIHLARLLLICGLVVCGMSLHNLFRAAPQYTKQYTSNHRLIQWIALAVGAAMSVCGFIMAVRISLIIANTPVSGGG